MTDLRDVLQRHGREEGDPDDLVRNIVNSIPPQLAGAEVLEPSSPLPRYLFAPPLRLGMTGRAWSTEDATPVLALYCALRVAAKHMTPKQRSEWLTKLAIPTKHLDWLVEMRPLSYIRDGVTATYEDFEFSPSPPDWKIVTVDWTFVVEVKRRIGHTARHLQNVLEAHSVHPRDVAPETDPEGLLRQIGPKFPGPSGSRTVQIAWLAAGWRESRDELTKYFISQSELANVDVVVIADWLNECSLITRDEQKAVAVLGFFGLEPSNKYLFSAPSNKTVLQNTEKGSMFDGR